VNPKKVLVTPRSLSSSGHPGLKRLEAAGFEIIYPSPGRQPSEDELIAVIGDAAAYLAGVEPITARIIGAAKQLKVISRNGVGIDNIDMAAAKKAGIEVTVTGGANSRGVAELAFGCILAAARSIPSGDAALKGRKWTRESGFELEGKNLGLIGCGRIGRQVALFGLAFGMKVRAYDPYPDSDFKPGPDFSYSGFDSVIRDSEVISLHCPPVKGEYVINRAVIQSMKKGVVLVNTARSGLIDETAAIEALESGHMRFLTNDAYEAEPPEDWTLAVHPRVIATPHIGGFTVESVDRATEAAIDNILARLR
jgi:phosphoglycerate dehydrogenase-like enzyme